MNTRFFAFVAVLLLPCVASAENPDWEQRLSEALVAGSGEQAETWSRLKAQQPRETRAGHLRFMGSEFNSPDVMPLVLDRLAHGGEPEEVRAALADVVGRFSPGWGDALIELLSEEPASSVRAVLVHGLRRIEPEFAGPGFSLALLDRSPEVRAEAARLVARREDGLLVAPSLVDLLGDEASSVRAAAAFSLGVLGSVEAISSVIPLLSDGSADVRLQALRALGRIDATMVPTVTLQALRQDDDHRVARVASKLSGP